ncbi:MAG: lipopolysaccharide core heptose(I) kinase RfaP [Pseudomonadota bacterium]
MYFSLVPHLKNFFDGDKLFDQLMTLQGKIYRELEGRRTQRIEFNGQGYFIKQHFGIGWKEIFKNLFQCRLPILSARNEWLALQRLPKLDVATMQVAGFGSRGINPARRQSFLLTAELTDVISLEDFCKNWRVQPPPVLLKRALIKEVARIARVLHMNGINHRDFYICHFLLAQSSIESGALKLFLIDLHRAQIRSETPVRWIIKDLAGLFFSSKDSGLTSRDLLRFIREYRMRPWRETLFCEWTFWKKVKQRGDRTYQRHEK